TWIWIIIVTVALIGGVALGFFLARKYMMDYLEKNPPINEDMLRMMMMQMGQKPSQKKINQMMTMMNKQTHSKKAKKQVKEAKKKKINLSVSHVTGGLFLPTLNKYLLFKHFIHIEMKCFLIKNVYFRNKIINLIKIAIFQNIH